MATVRGRFALGTPLDAAFVPRRDTRGGEDLHDVGAAFDLLVESFGLFDQIFCQCAFGNAVNARTSVLTSPSMAAIRVRHVETWAVSLADPGAVHHTIRR